MRRATVIISGFVLIAVMSLFPQPGYPAGGGPAGGADAAGKILSVASEDNRAMLHLDRLVNDIGPRPANTLNFLKACKWARGEFESFGLEGVHLEKCGEIKGYFPDEATSDLYRRLYSSMFGVEHGGEMVDIYNVVADIRGTEFPDELVIVGAHLDCSPHGPGAADNGAGVAAVMEAARLLADSGVRPRRTIRFILFGGEEVGLVGSNGYVDDHPELIPKISAMYNMDHGSNYISGIMATAPLKEDMEAIFASAAAAGPGMPFDVQDVDYLPRADPDCCAAMISNIDDASGTRRVVSHEQCGAGGAGTARGCGPGMPGLIKKEVTAEGDTVVKHIYIGGAPCGGKDLDLESLDLGSLGISPKEISSDGTVKKIMAMGSSDHAPFLAAGIPAFWWKQDVGGDVPYPAHTSGDTYDKVDARHLEHSAVVIALGALGTANLDHMLSRERLAGPAAGAAGDEGAAACGGCSPACGKDGYGKRQETDL